MADRHIARALAAAAIRRDPIQRSACDRAAAAMRHAAALSAEILHLGGTPAPLAERLAAGGGWRGGASGLFRRYQRRLNAAARLGLFRLEEVLHGILRELRASPPPCGATFRTIRMY